MLLLLWKCGRADCAATADLSVHGDRMIAVVINYADLPCGCTTIEHDLPSVSPDLSRLANQIETLNTIGGYYGACVRIYAHVCTLNPTNLILTRQSAHIHTQTLRHPSHSSQSIHALRVSIKSIVIAWLPWGNRYYLRMFIVCVCVCVLCMSIELNRSLSGHDSVAVDGLHPR